MKNQTSGRWFLRENLGLYGRVGRMTGGNMELTEKKKKQGDTGKRMLRRANVRGKKFLASFGKLPKKKKIIIGLGVLLIAGIICTGAVVFAGKEVNAQIVQEAEATKGTISNTIAGTGNLELGSSTQIEIPSGITIQDVLVESGDKVKKGDTLATVDRASVLSALSNTQEKIGELDTQINEKKGETVSSQITAGVSGRIKKIYAKKGDSVLESMNDRGALMLLSLDGKMAVSISDAGGLSEGDSVTVILSDQKTKKTGSVESVTDGTAVITLTDNGPKFGETVTVKKGNSSIGSGKLYIHSQLAVVASGGTVKTLHVSQNQYVSAGKCLYTLKDLPASTEYQQLLAQRQKLTDVLADLAAMTASNSITASESGTIEAVKISSASESGSQTENSNASAENTTGSSTAAGVASNQTGTSVKLMSDTGDEKKSRGDESASAQTWNDSVSASKDEIDAAAQADTVTSIPSVSISIAAPVKGGLPQQSIEASSQYTGIISWNLKDKVFQADSTYTARITLTAQSGCRFTQATAVSVDALGAVISGISTDGEGEGNTMIFTVTFAKTQADSTKSDSAAPNKQKNASSGKAASQTSKISSSGAASASSASGNTSGASSASESSSATEEIQTVAAFTLCSDETMVLPINVDELDILSVEKGQEAEVTFDAIEGKNFTGKITKVSGAATVSGGTAKYSVEITLDAEDSMRLGMNGAATVTTSSKEDILIVPLSALQESGEKTFVYTQKDEDVTLSGKKEVETGISNDENVEITSGLSQGEKVYYLRSGSVSQSGSSDSMMPGQGGGFGDGSGGRQQMPSGGGMPPSGQ